MLIEVEAKCPKCGIRIVISALEHHIIDPVSRCKNKGGWSICSGMRATQTKARTELNRLPRLASDEVVSIGGQSFFPRA
jgi:hypothetical protein